MDKQREKRLLEMVKMRLDGCTFQEIADEYGVSRQCVQQSIADFTGKKKTVKKSSLDKCIYPNIREWMRDSGITMIRLSGICGLNESSQGVIRAKLLGQREFKISEIRAILKESGKSFEHMFRTEETGVERQGKGR